MRLLHRSSPHHNPPPSSFARPYGVLSLRGLHLYPPSSTFRARESHEWVDSFHRGNPVSAETSKHRRSTLFPHHIRVTPSPRPLHPAWDGCHSPWRPQQFESFCLLLILIG